MNGNVAERFVVDDSQRLSVGHWVAITAMLAVRTFRLRYLRSRLGIGWAFIQPLAQALVLAFIFTRIFEVTRVPHYPLYVLSGIMTWQAFASCVNQATTSAVDNASLLRKVDMPALVFPLAQIGSVLMVFSLQVLVLLVAAAFTGTLDAGVLLILPAGLLLALIAIGLGTLTCSLHVALRDTKFLVESGLLMAFYATPILYDPQLVPERLREVLELNPVYGVLALMRSALLDRPLELRPVLVAVAVATLLLVVGLASFSRRSRDFADLA